MLSCACTRDRHDITVAVVRRSQIHFTLHLLDVSLSVIDHLYCLLPLLIKCCLCLFDVLFLELDPSVNLFLLCLESSRWELILLELLPDLPALFLFLKLNNLLTEFDQFWVLTALHNHLELLLRVLLKSVSIEERTARLASPIVKVVPICIDAVSFDASWLNRGLVLTEIKLTV